MMLTCRHLTELVTDYVEGRMPFWQRARLQLHLGMCRHVHVVLVVPPISRIFTTLS